MFWLCLCFLENRVFLRSCLPALGVAAQTSDRSGIADAAVHGDDDKKVEAAVCGDFSKGGRRTSVFSKKKSVIASHSIREIWSCDFGRRSALVHTSASDSNFSLRPTHNSAVFEILKACSRCF